MKTFAKVLFSLAIMICLPLGMVACGNNEDIKITGLYAAHDNLTFEYNESINVDLFGITVAYSDGTTKNIRDISDDERQGFDVVVEKLNTETSTYEVWNNNQMPVGQYRVIYKYGTLVLNISLSVVEAQ